MSLPATVDLGVVVTLFLAWSGLLMWGVKWLLDRYTKVMEDKLTEMAREVKEVKTDLASLRAELPAQYVRQDHCKNCREENQRVLAMIDQRLTMFADKIMEKIDAVWKEMYTRER
jgi:hypothetical protein